MINCALFIGICPNILIKGDVKHNQTETYITKSLCCFYSLGSSDCFTGVRLTEEKTQRRYRRTEDIERQGKTC